MIDIVVVAKIAIKYWFAPQANPIPITKKRYTNSSGSFIAALNLTIDNAPTSPSDKANENLITVITKQVIVAKGINWSEKYNLLLNVFEFLIKVIFIRYARKADRIIDITKLVKLISTDEFKKKFCKLFIWVASSLFINFNLDKY